MRLGLTALARPVLRSERSRTGPLATRTVTGKRDSLTVEIVSITTFRSTLDNSGVSQRHVTIRCRLQYSNKTLFIRIYRRCLAFVNRLLKANLTRIYFSKR